MLHIQSGGYRDQGGFPLESLMRSNILLIQVDQMNARCLGLLGNCNLRTPNLDALAAQGVTFTSAHCQSPICMPSRASMLSGQYPSTNRVFGFDGLGRPGTPRIQSAFKQAGYRTAAFGKLHVHNIAPWEWDMDEAAPTAPEDMALARPADNSYMHFCRAKGYPWPSDQMHCHVPPSFSESWFPPRVNPGPEAPPEEWFRSASPLDGSLETYTTDRCLGFLRGCAADGSPFFAWLTYDRPHVPVTLPQPWFDRMREKVVDLPPVPTADDLASLPRWMIEKVYEHPEFSRASLGEARFRCLVAAYYTSIEFLDAEIGRVMRELEAQNLSENTTVVFCSDHGDQAGWGGLFDKQPFSASDAITRVPLIIRPAPALQPAAVGRRVGEPVELVDLFPTLCGISGIQPPEALEGVDLSPTVVRGEGADPTRAVFCEEVFTRSLLHRNRRLVFHVVDGNCMLFDLDRDPHGFRNLYYDASQREVRFDLKRRLLAFLCARIYGPYDARDIERVEQALDPGHERLSLFVFDMPHCEGLHYHRAAAIFYDGQHHLLVPFYDREPALFHRRFLYPSWDDAIVFDMDVAEPILDQALRTCMRSTLPVSRLEAEHPDQSPLERAAIEALHARLTSTGSRE